jgi:hypothetical protein
MNDTELVATVRNIRRLVTSMDSLGLPVRDLMADPEFAEFVPHDLTARLIKTNNVVYKMLQRIEKSVAYQKIVKTMFEGKRTGAENVGNDHWRSYL